MYFGLRGIRKCFVNLAAKLRLIYKYFTMKYLAGLLLIQH